MTRRVATSTERTRYRCPNCGKRFIRDGIDFSCCVDHPHGECCHAFEREVAKKGWPKRARRESGEETDRE